MDTFTRDTPWTYEENTTTIEFTRDTHAKALLTVLNLKAYKFNKVKLNSSLLNVGHIKFDLFKLSKRKLS